MRRSVRLCIAALALGLLPGLSATAEIIGQWDFASGDFTATVGNPLAYAYPTNQDSVTGTLFGTTTALGVPNIGGTPADVMKVPKPFGATDLDFGYVFEPSYSGGGAHPGNGGGFLINHYTLIMDILYPPASMGSWAAIYASYAYSLADAEFFKNASDAIGINGDYEGTMLADTWHRIVVVVDTSDLDTGIMHKYIDGVKVGETTVTGQDYRWALDNYEVGMFVDNTASEMQECYVSSIQWRDELLTEGKVAALGGAVAAGIPATLPPAASFIDSWTPAIDYAPPTTDMGVVINAEDANLSSIVFTLDGVAQSPSITVDGVIHTVSLANAAAGGPFLVGTTHTNVISYFDDVLGGTVTDTNIFEIPLFLEDFEGLALGASPEEDPSQTDVWTQTGPPGWSIDNSMMLGFGDDLTDGVSDWAGWAFADKAFWVDVAGDQDRSLFANGVGTVAIADGDEWDDAGHTDTMLNTFLQSPPIPLAGAAENSAFLIFDSSWWDEDFQTATIDVSFDGGTNTQVLRWSSVGSEPDYKGYSPNENVTVTLNNPAGATSMVLTFGYIDAGNDWWWAIDNVVVKAGQVAPFISSQPQGLEVDEGDPATFMVDAGGGSLTYQWYTGTGTGRTAIVGANGPEYTIPGTTVANDRTIYSVDVINAQGAETSDEVELRVVEVLVGTILLDENFNGVALGSWIDEAGGGCSNVWSADPPAGWPPVDRSGVPGIGDPATDGVVEFAGWNFMNVDWYIDTAGDQQRSFFTLGSGTIAVADGDEWDDAAHPAGLMDTFMDTLPIDVSGAAPGTLNLKFDSSWRDYANQTATITVSYDGGPSTQVVRWASQGADPDFKNDNENEAVTIALGNPAASSMVVTFGYTDAGNDWWWAFDNLVVDDGTTTYLSEDFESIPLGQPIEEAACGGGVVWTETPPTDWVLDDSGVPSIGSPDLGMTEWEGWAFVEPDAWYGNVGLDRDMFTKGDVAIAVADPEGWEDKGTTETLALGPYSALMSTPDISLAGVSEDTVAIQFDSSWQPNKSDDPLNQTAVLTASYDGGPAVEVLRWESDDTGPDYKATDWNETVTFHLDNPAGAANLVLEFGLLNAGNDRWWAIDNLVVVATVVEGPTITSLNVAGGNATLTWDPAGSADQVQKATDLVGEDWGDVGAPTDQGTATVPATGDVMLLRVTQ